MLNIDVQDLNSNFTVYDTIDNWLDWLSEVLLLHINLSDLSNVKCCTDHVSVICFIHVICYLIMLIHLHC